MTDFERYLTPTSCALKPVSVDACVFARRRGMHTPGGWWWFSSQSDAHATLALIQSAGYVVDDVETAP